MKFKSQQANEAYKELLVEVGRCVTDLTSRAEKTGGLEKIALLGRATETHIQGHATAIQVGALIDKINAETVIGAQMLAHAMDRMGRS